MKDSKPAEAANKQDDDDDYDDEYYEEEDGRWLCNGSKNFKDGCKSGQVEFDFYLGTEGWSSQNPECDFDLCDMCIRWVLYCEKNRMDPGWIDDEPAKEPEDPLPSEYLTERDLERKDTM